MQAKIFVRLECDELFGKDTATYECLLVEARPDQLPDKVEEAAAQLAQRATNYMRSRVGDSRFTL